MFSESPIVVLKTPFDVILEVNLDWPTRLDAATTVRVETRKSPFEVILDLNTARLQPTEI